MLICFSVVMGVRFWLVLALVTLTTGCRTVSKTEIPKSCVEATTNELSLERATLGIAEAKGDGQKANAIRVFLNTWKAAAEEKRLKPFEKVFFGANGTLFGPTNPYRHAAEIKYAIFFDRSNNPASFLPFLIEVEGPDTALWVSLNY